jgi:predicted benzoate:H+ symporter BenE
MTVFADSIVDWGALLDVILISAFAGLAIALTLGVGIVSSLRAQDHKGNAMALHAVTVVSVALVAGAIAVGIYYIADK